MMAADFEALVRDLEDEAGDGGYRLKVALLAALGYAYVVILVGLVVGAVAMLAAAMKDGRHLALLKLAIPLAVVGFVGLRALWVRLDPPEGRVLAAREAPKLFALLGKIRRRLKGPPIHRVVVDGHFNAAIMQLPRFGLLGGSRNHLIVGLPLMQALTLEQFAAVLAHEYGHLSGAHGHFSAWIYRVRAVWARILQAFEERPVWGSGLFVRFFRWYVPYFEAYTFVLARSNEYEADRAAAQVAGARHAADALAQVSIGGRFLDERFWSTFYAGADKAIVPMALPYAQLPVSLQVGLDPKEAQGWLKAALMEETGVADTHPSLKDRLKALGEPARVPPRAETSAARVLLGAAYGPIVAELDKGWSRMNLAGWEERHRESLALKERAAELSAKARRGEALSADEWHDFGLACERFASVDKAESCFRRALGVSADHYDSHLDLGYLLWRRDDEACLVHLERAMEAGGDIAMSAARIASRYLRAAGRVREAERFEVKAMAQSAREEQDEAHRVYLLPDDSYAPHGLTAKELALATAVFRRLPRVGAAWAVRKILPGSGEPHLVVVLEYRVGLIEGIAKIGTEMAGIQPRWDASVVGQVLDALKLSAPFTVFIDMTVEDAILARVREVENSRIYSR